MRAVLAHQHEVASLFVEMRNPRGQTEGGAGKWAIVYGRHIVAYLLLIDKRPVALSIRRGLIVTTATRDTLSTGAPRAVRPRISLKRPVPFDRDASAALDDLVLQLEQRPGRWKTRILRLRKLIWERRALGRAGR